MSQIELLTLLVDLDLLIYDSFILILQWCIHLLSTNMNLTSTIQAEINQ